MKRYADDGARPNDSFIIIIIIPRSRHYRTPRAAHEPYVVRLRRYRYDGAAFSPPPTLSVTTTTTTTTAATTAAATAATQQPQPMIFPAHHLSIITHTRARANVLFYTPACYLRLTV